MDKDIIIKYLINELEKLEGQSVEYTCHDCGQVTDEGSEHRDLIEFIENKIKELKKENK